jgi:hypothetical protein
MEKEKALMDEKNSLMDEKKALMKKENSLRDEMKMTEKGKKQQGGAY